MQTQQNDWFEGQDSSILDTTNYMKPKSEGAHKFRALSSPIVGYIYFKNDNKPVRSRVPFDETPDIKPNGKINKFWAFVVYNYNAKRIQILEISQKTIQTQILALKNNPDWGNPKDFDITINRKGTTQNDTEYTIVPSPHKPVDEAIKTKYENMKIDLNALYDDGDPFATE
jgi:hypothetical protein